MSVTVWREARRLKAGEQISEAVEAVREVEDQGNWKQFTQLMGGVFCKGKDQLLRPYYGMEFNQQTGLIKTSFFDGLITLKLKGILHAGHAIITRLHQWRLEYTARAFSPSLGVL